MLTPLPPYDFEKLLALLRRYAYPALDRVHEHAYRRVFAVNGNLALVEVTSHGTAENPVLKMDILAQTEHIDENMLLHQVRHVLGIDYNRAAFFDMAQQDEKLWSVVMPVYGLPALHTADEFEALMTVIIEQQIAWRAAQRAQQWLVEWGGRCIEYKNESYYAFPTPQQIASTTIEELKPLKITFKRMGMMIDLAKQVAEGNLVLENVTYESLLKIKGIGHWTAAVILGRAYGQRSHLTYNDVALQAAVNRYFYGQKGRATPQMLIETFTTYNHLWGEAAYYTLLRWVFDEY